ncbi:MAG: glycosyltransferase family 4 protein [Lachnospiraceae bacterium]|nr:glycosyltransferase family 4 protein [Lachnospiraceae bacterium]
MSDVRVFLIGDDWSGTGPANVTRAYRDHLPENTLYLKEKNKVKRAIELAVKMKKADCAFFSGHSRQNILGMKLAAMKGIPSIYLMHGCVEYENMLNRVPNDRMADDEKEMMERADLLLAVSRQFETWLKEHYPKYKDKISHLTNGIDWDSLKVNENVEKHGEFSIISVGGGMPRKKIINICKAIDILRKSGVSGITLTVAGADGADTEEINKYEFVNNVGLVRADKMLELYSKSRIFVQNSVFETFGLAPVEALLSGCDILLSRKCGVLSSLGGINDTDLINDYEDVDEIASKLREILLKGNNARILSNTNKEHTSWENRSKELMTIAEKMVSQGQS